MQEIKVKEKGKKDEEKENYAWLVCACARVSLHECTFVGVHTCVRARVCVSVLGVCAFVYFALCIFGMFMVI